MLYIGEPQCLKGVWWVDGVGSFIILLRIFFITRYHTYKWNMYMCVCDIYISLYNFFLSMNNSKVSDMYVWPSWRKRALPEPWELPVFICITVHLPFLSHSITIMTKCFNCSLVFFWSVFYYMCISPNHMLLVFSVFDTCQKFCVFFPWHAFLDKCYPCEIHLYRCI